MRAIPLLIVLAFTMSACSETPRTIVRDVGERSVVTRVERSLYKDALALRAYDGSVVSTGFGLDLLAQIDAPRFEGTTLQATDVLWRDDWIVASYNTRDELFLGALQVIDASNPLEPVLVSEVIYPRTDVNRLRRAGDRLYAAAADAVEGGTLEIWQLGAGGELTALGWQRLGSFSGTFLDIDDLAALAAFGDYDGGVQRLALGDDEVAEVAWTVPLHDARWVEALEDGSWAAIQGPLPNGLRPARLVLGDAEGIVSETPIEGARIGAPTWATRRGDRLFVSSDDAGLLVYDLRDGRLIGSLTTEGTANGLAIALDGRLAFLANGEEGLVVADVQDPASPALRASIDVADDAGSANAVALHGSLIALADGLGGVKLLRFDRDAVDPDDCDGDGVPNLADPDDDDDGTPDELDAAPCDPDAVCPEGTLTVPGRFVADFYNLPCDHPDVEGPITGVVTGTLPWDFDWFSEDYYAFSLERDSLVIDYAENYFPVDEGLCGDPFYFAAHWRATLVVDTPGTYAVELGSDDDSWLFVDDTLLIDLGGIHALRRTRAEIELSAGAHRFDVYFAERHVSQSGLEFEIVGMPEGAFVDVVQHVCLEPDGDADGDGIPNNEDLAPLVRNGE